MLHLLTQKIYIMKIHISGRVDEKILELAKKAANLENRSFNNFLEKSLEDKAKSVIRHQIDF